jgi:hypothetical protein
MTSSGATEDDVWAVRLMVLAAFALLVAPTKELAG